MPLSIIDTIIMAHPFFFPALVLTLIAGLLLIELRFMKSDII